MASTIDFHPAMMILFRETFEGIRAGASGTWYVQGKQGLFDAFANTDAERASRKPSETCSTIAAHALHILYALRLFNAEHGGKKPDGSWEDSWRKQAVTPEEWSETIGQIEAEYKTMMVRLAAEPAISDEDDITYALSNLPHLAYHLGAIRQLMLVV